MINKWKRSSQMRVSRKHLSCQSTRHTLSSHDLTSNVCRTGQTANQIPEPSHCIFLIECRAAIAWLCRVPDTNEEQGKREVHLYCAVHCNPSSLLRFYFCFFFFSFYYCCLTFGIGMFDRYLLMLCAVGFFVRPFCNTPYYYCRLRISVSYGRLAQWPLWHNQSTREKKW